jgi:hypothetical protein
MRQLSFHIVRIATFAIFSTSVLLAQHHKHEAKPDASPDAASHNCYDASDPSEIRLWPGAAPGATGDDPCRDIPYLRVFRSPKAASRSGQGLIVIPGGGYDCLSDAKEQAPVADYFSRQLGNSATRQLGVTTFVLYYRVVQPDGSYRYPIPMWDGQRARLEADSDTCPRLRHRPGVGGPVRLLSRRGTLPARWPCTRQQTSISRRMTRSTGQTVLVNPLSLWITHNLPRPVRTTTSSTVTPARPSIIYRSISPARIT